MGFDAMCQQASIIKALVGVIAGSKTSKAKYFMQGVDFFCVRHVVVCDPVGHTSWGVPF
jgi:hypothetical protein